MFLFRVHKNNLNKAGVRNKLKLFNITSLVGLLIILILYTIIVNGCTGSALEIQKLEKEKDVLRIEIGNQANFINNLKVPSYIQSGIEPEMVKTSEISYLQEGDSQVAVLHD